MVEVPQPGQVQLDGTVGRQRLELVQQLRQPQEGRVARSPVHAAAVQRPASLGLHMDVRGLPRRLDDRQQQPDQHALEHVGPRRSRPRSPRAPPPPPGAPATAARLPYGNQLPARVHQHARQRRERNHASAAGSSATNSSSHTPCSTREALVRAPACTFAELRTMTAVIGSAPSAPHTVLPAPCAISSLS